jgi:L-amino acid N-acyltransferase YncA
MRPAQPPDAEAIARIYNEGIEERQATFETQLRSAEDFEQSISRAGTVPLLVAEREGQVVAWAVVKPYSDRDAYRRVGECMLYVTRRERRRGTGRGLLNALAQEAERGGYVKLIGRLLTDNEASVALVRRCGFREVGVHNRHGRLDGRWRDVLVVEKLIGEAAQ